MLRANLQAFRVRVLQAAALAVALLVAVPAAASAADDCHVGAYRLADDSFVDIAPEDDGLRWSRFDGTTGYLTAQPGGGWKSTLGWGERQDGVAVSFSDCAVGEISFNGMAGRRIAFDVRPARFTSHGVTLVGRLILPTGADRVPIVVLVHGSEQSSALATYSLQRVLPAAGVGAFVYDKRGTGVSGGQYTQDFGLLADDAVAAMREARRLAGPRLGRIGYHGGSEGGWVAPLAANRAPVDFVIVAFGLAVSVIDEDQEEVAMEMGEEGHSPAEIAKGQQVAAAAEAVIASGFTEGFAELDAVRAKYGHEPWYKDVHGDFAHFLLPYSKAELLAMAPKFRWGTPFYYDPMPALRANATPQLWVVGGEDYEAPAVETSRRITSLIDAGRPFTLADFPHAEHGITLFDTAPNGERTSTRWEPGYYAMIRDYARDGTLHGVYGEAVVTGPPAPRR